MEKGRIVLFLGQQEELQIWNVFLPPQIAVLCVRTIAEIGPQTMQCPRISW